MYATLRWRNIVFSDRLRSSLFQNLRVEITMVKLNIVYGIKLVVWIYMFLGTSVAGPFCISQ